MRAIQGVRTLWGAEIPLYEKIGNDISNVLSSAIKAQGMSAKISYRVKETDSLIKKIARKDSNYEAIRDKVGVRIVAYFKDQLRSIDSLISEVFCENVNKREDMSVKLGEAVFGYQSIHYDICKIIDGKEHFCEVQLRTICQDNWSELSHALAYKTEINIPLDVKREINALSAIFELADNQFQMIQTLIGELPDTSPIQILNYLEKIFYSKIGDTYDQELSAYFLKDINSLYVDANPRLEIQRFLSTKEVDVLKVIDDNRDNFFFTQPEIILILERLENSKYSLAEFWNTLYPQEELEGIANAWGTSIE